jgi:hypothetical protein
MYNAIIVAYLQERLHGKKLSSILAECSGVSERTWRNRAKKGWDPSPRDIEAISAFGERVAVDQLRKEKWSEVEIAEILGRAPSRAQGAPRPMANLIFLMSPAYGKDYEEAINVAVEFDIVCNAMEVSFRSGDASCVIRSILEASQWLRRFREPHEDATDADQFDADVRTASDVATLKRLADKLADEMLFHVFSCWDLVFCSRYFNGKLKPTPLFSIVMPRLARGIEIDPESGRFLRDGEQPKTLIFEKSISRLFDFLSVLVHYSQQRRFPSEPPPVNLMAAWFKENDSRIVSWRDETTRFTARQLGRIWVGEFRPKKDGSGIGIPSPMLVAALFWSRLLERTDGKITAWYVCFDPYEAWWARNLARLKGKGFAYGDIPLPSFLTDQPVINRSPSLWLSSQSSGCSS